ncbi:hypothetical protein EOD23_17360 [Mesorhizobium sp. USDA-HM6]|nr:hypothetical protein EOD23_17360 [Mesorhizobium sp. USDA-HM6]
MTALAAKEKVNAPVRLAKVLDPATPRSFCFELMAYTDVIGGNAMDTKYAKELLTIDPFAELEDDCLIVLQFRDGSPFMARWSKTGKDQNGRFVRPGSESEAFGTHFGMTYTKADIGQSLNVLGRVVGTPREFPRQVPMTYTNCRHANN